MIREMPNQTFMVSAPGAICLFGEEIAPLGLRTIHMAINMRVYIRAETVAEHIYRVEIPAENRMDEFAPRDLAGRADAADPVRRAVCLLQRDGLEFGRGCRFEISTEIPPGIGLGYSAAVAVAWVTALLQLHDNLADSPARRIARVACEAAALDGANPVRMADYLSSAAGGVNVIDPGNRFEMTPIPRALDGLIIVYAELEGRPGPDTRAAADAIAEAGRRLREIDPTMDFAKTPTDDIIKLLKRLPDSLAAAAYAVAVDRDTTEKARDLLTQEVFDQDAFGEMFDSQHEMLRDHLGLAVPQIDRLIEVGKLGGALGGRLNLPTGRTATIYAPGRTQPVLAALREAGARPCVVTKTHGVAFEGV
ncbi:MAG: hypothetical protein AB1696_14395 [Planctomycetota bacterium]